MVHDIDEPLLGFSIKQYILKTNDSVYVDK